MIFTCRRFLRTFTATHSSSSDLTSSLFINGVKLAETRLVPLRKVVHVVAGSVPESDHDPQSAHHKAEQEAVPARHSDEMCDEEVIEVVSQIYKPRIIAVLQQFPAPFYVVEGREQRHLVSPLDVVFADDELDAGVARCPHQVEGNRIKEHESSPLKPAYIVVNLGKQSFLLGHISLQGSHLPAQVLGHDQRHQMLEERCKVVNSMECQGVAEGVYRDSEDTIRSNEANTKQSFIFGVKVNQVDCQVVHHVAVVCQVHGVVNVNYVVDVPPNHVVGEDESDDAKVVVQRESTNQVGVRNNKGDSINEIELVCSSLERGCVVQLLNSILLYSKAFL